MKLRFELCDPGCLLLRLLCQLVQPQIKVRLVSMIEALIHEEFLGAD